MRSARELLAELVRRYPAFSYPQRPLAIGIFSVLQEKLPDVDPKVIRAALKLWTSTTRYQIALQARIERINLYAAPAGPLPARRFNKAERTNDSSSVARATATPRAPLGGVDRGHDPKPMLHQPFRRLNQ
jgi:sRNA-binding protein